MSSSAYPYANLFFRLMVAFMLSAVGVYVLRGMGILTFIPGGIIYLLFLGAIGLGLLSKLARRQRW